MDFGVPADHEAKMKESKKILPEIWKNCKTKVTEIIIVVGALWRVSKGMKKRGNTWKSPEHLKRLGVTKTPVKRYHLKVLLNTCKA